MTPQRLTAFSNYFRFSFLCGFLCVALSGCQSARYREFESLHVGMEKAEVLDAIGEPDAKARWRGMDRWTYTFRDRGGSKISKEVHLREGRAIYVGTPKQPEISASEQDRINLLQNTRAEENERSRRNDGISTQTFTPVDSDDSSASSTK